MTQKEEYLAKRQAPTWQQKERQAQPWQSRRRVPDPAYDDQAQGLVGIPTKTKLF